MKLRKGLKVTLGHKTWVGEIPDRQFALMTIDWTKTQIDEFMKRHAEKVPVKKEKAD